MNNHYFKTWLWAGLTLAAVFVIARPTLAAEIIVDDGDAGYADTGWTLSVNPPDAGYGDDIHYAPAGDGSQIATSTPTIPTTGSYHVYVSWTTHPNRATDAPYTVNYSGGSQTFTVNQELLNDQLTAGGSGQWSDWYLLGTFAFDAGTTGNVVLKNNANEYVIADAVKFVSTTFVVDDDSVECTADYSTIQAAVDAASAGDTIEVCPGTYTETVTFASPDNLTITGNALSKPVITGGIYFSNASDMVGLTLENLYIKGQAPTGDAVIDMENTGKVTDFTLKNSVIDGENVSGRHGLTGSGLAGDISMTYNEFKNILGWALMDLNSGSGDGSSDYAFGHVVFSNNNVHDSNGSVALRGDAATKTTLVDVVGNTWTNIGGNGSETGDQWAAMEVNHADTLNVQDNIVTGMKKGNAGEGQAFQFWDITTLSMTGNNIYDNEQGVFYFGGSLGGPFGGPYAIPAGAVANNSFENNGDFGLSIDPAATGGPLNAEQNWWGACSGPTHATNPAGTGDVVSDNVDFDPWTGCLARVSGMKFDDVNGNGVNDTEPGLEGWTIYGAEEVETLYVDSSNGAGMTTSNILGIGESYLVRVSGTYTAGDSITADAKYSVRPPNSIWTDSVQNYESYGPALLDLQIDGVSPDWGAYNANHVYWYSLTGAGATLNFKVNDIHYPSNAGMLAVTVYKVLGSGITASDGTYSFSFTSYVNQIIVAEETQTGLPAQAGWTQTVPMPDGYYAVNLPGSAPDLDFGNYKYGTIEGMKYEDMNNNGVHDEDEPGLEGWTITLTSLNPVGPVMTYLTNPDGTYSFVNLVPGEYFVEETLQTNWYKSEPVASGYTVTISTSGQTELLNFGNYRKGAITGMKFKDTNGNGVKNAGELGMGGWTITLNPGNLTMVTAPDGTYAFTDLTPGIYELTETMQPGWGQTYPGDTGIQEVMVHSGETVIDIDFGNFELGIIKGFKFNDYNGNGVKNAGEPKLPGWRIILINLQTGRQQSMLTNASGNYQFTDLLPGRYILREQMKPLWLPSAPANGMYTVVIDASGQILQRNFGNRQIPLPRRR